MRAVARLPTCALVGLTVIALGTGAFAGAAGAQIEAPQRGAPLESVWMDVGDVVQVDVSTGFVGVVDSYSAGSQDDTAVSFSIAGSILSLRAVAVGVAFIEITATNTAGSTPQWIGVASGIPGPGTAAGTAASDTGDGTDTGSTTAGEPGADAAQPLGIAVAAQAFCYSPNTNEMSAVGRDRDSILTDGSRVGRFDLAYSVVGGRPPFVIASPSPAGTVSARSGTLEMACAHPAPEGTDPTAQQYYLYRDGPVTLAIEVSDAAGETVSARIVMHVEGFTYEVDNGDGTKNTVLQVPGLANPGSSYVLATPTAWTLVTLAPGLDIRFEHLDAEGIALFTDAGNGWEVRLNWTSGSEVGRVTGTTPDTNRVILWTAPIVTDTDGGSMSAG